jgi:hypothetical protein
MATDAQKRLWQEQMHKEYCSWIESINASNRAHANNGPALITDPETGRQRMQGLGPGQMVWFDVKDGPQSQRGRRHFYGPNWHGPFPEYGIIDMLTAVRPPTAQECLQLIFDFKTVRQSVAARTAASRDDFGILQRLRAALHLKPHR